MNDPTRSSSMYSSSVQGRAGLATGYFLQRTGVRFRLFDGSTRVGDSWRRRYDSLVLFRPTVV